MALDGSDRGELVSGALRRALGRLPAVAALKATAVVLRAHGVLLSLQGLDPTFHRHNFAERRQGAVGCPPTMTLTRPLLAGAKG